MSERFVLIGAHLEEEDAAIDGVTCLPAGPVALSAAAYAADQSLGNRTLISRVASLRALLVQRETFIAIRYGASVAGLEEAAAKAAPHGNKWRELLVRHRGTFEMTLKVLAAEAVPDPDRKHFRSGADYLRALHAARSAKRPHPEFAAAAEESFRPLATAARWVAREDAAFEYAFLVPRARFDEVKGAAESLKERFGDLPFLLSGPWPLEVFADD